jgi:hypothetical protein
MKRNLIVLTLGVVIGFGIRSLFFQESPTAPDRPENHIPSAKLVAVEQKAVENLPKPARSPSVTQPQKEDRDPKAPEQTYGLVINEENIAEMEQHWETLPDYAYATQTQEGWKIEILPEDRVFLKAGMSSGDLITFESMNAQLQNSERAQLADRMVTILNRILR